MQIEVHLIRGDANTVLEFQTDGNLKVSIQMGRPQEEVSEQCSKVVDPVILKRIIRLWCDPDHPRQMIESGRNLIIREIS